MDSQTFSSIMHITSEASMLPFWLLSALLLSFSSRFLSYLLCRDCLLLLFSWFYHSFPLVLLNAWKRKGMQQLHLHWHGYCPIYPYPGVAQLVQSSMTYMLCRFVLLTFQSFKGVVGFFRSHACLLLFNDFFFFFYSFSLFTKFRCVLLNEK